MQYSRVGPGLIVISLLVSVPILAFAQTADRIITLSPHAAELVDAAGAADRLVGVTAFTDHPEHASRLPVVGDARSLDRERVLWLSPDLVIAWEGGNREIDLEWLESRGIRVFRSHPKKLEDITREIREIGRLTATERQAEEKARALDARISRLRQMSIDNTPVRYFFQVWPRPPMTFGGDSILVRALATCGGRNLFSDIPRETFSVDPEALLTLEADIELIPSDLPSAVPLTRAPRVLQVDVDPLYRPGPRLFEAVESLCRALGEGKAMRPEAISDDL